MSNTLPVPQTHVEPPEWYAEVPRSVNKVVTFALILMMVSFGGFGAWAFLAPLAAAVISQGSFVATGRNKIVQHLEGGIIKEILVNEGDVVVAGQPIMLLDETSALANERELFLRRVRLEAMQARILAEYGKNKTLTFPEELRSLRTDFEVASMLDAQQIIFDSTNQQLRNDIGLLEQSIEALTVRALGYSEQLIAARQQNAILQEDYDSKSQLLEQGLIRKSEINVIRRALADSRGNIGRLIAEVDEITAVKKRYGAQIEQTISERKNKQLDELEAVQSELESVREKARKAENVLKRSQVLAPVSGTIVRQYYHTSGGVVESGKAIAEILPSGEALIIEAQIPRTAIDVVREGQHASVQLTALNQRTTPILQGEVYYVSADAIVDKSQDIVREVYIARVSVTPEELARVRGFIPTPGMPVQIMIQTHTRTFAQYLMKPIFDSMGRSFREQ